jgi:hypothetical protein
VREMASPDVHIKGRLLQYLEEGPQWDYELAARVESEYDEWRGEYCHNTVRMNLVDLHSGGLIMPEEETVDPSKTFGKEKMIFRFALTDFGRQRMKESGLLVGAGAKGIS